MFEQSWIPSLPPFLGTDRQLDWAATERHKLLVLAEHALRIGRSLPELPAAAVRDAIGWLGSIKRCRLVAGPPRPLRHRRRPCRARWRGVELASQ